MKHHPFWKTALAYSAVYVAWGSTYLAIRVAVRHFSTTGITGTRFILSGLIMGVFALWRRGNRARAMTLRELLNACLVGVVMLGGGNGCLIWAERTVVSSVAALVVSCSPIFFALFNWVAGGPPLTCRQAAGGLLSLVGLFFLSTGGTSLAVTQLPPTGLLILFCGTIFWTSASVASNYIRMPADTFLAAAVEMLAAGVVHWCVGLWSGDFHWTQLGSLPAQTWGAITYLAVVGSCVGFTAYAWLLRREPPNRLSSYAFVNPAVAVFLGVVFLGEPLTKSVAAAMFLVIGGVSFSMTGGKIPIENS